MADRRNLTFEDLAKVADQLIAAGEEPTARKVHALLGRGSMGTAQKYLKQWEKHRAPDRSISTRVIPTPALSALWEFVDAEVERARQLYVADIEKAKNEAAMLADDNERLHGEVLAAADEIRVLDEQRVKIGGHLEQLHAELGTVKVELDRERAKFTTVSMQLAAADVKLQRHEQSESEIKHLRAALDEQRAARAAAEQREAVLKVEKTYFEQRLSTMAAPEGPSSGTRDTATYAGHGRRLKPQARSHKDVSADEASAAEATDTLSAAAGSDGPEQISLLPPVGAADQALTSA